MTSHENALFQEVVLGLENLTRVTWSKILSAKNQFRFGRKCYAFHFLKYFIWNLHFTENAYQIIFNSIHWRWHLWDITQISKLCTSSDTCCNKFNNKGQGSNCVQFILSVANMLYSTLETRLELRFWNNQWTQTNGGGLAKWSCGRWAEVPYPKPKPTPAFTITYTRRWHKTQAEVR